MIKDVMTKDIVAIEPSEYAVTAAKKMNDNKVGSLLVMKKNRLVGMVTDRKITTGVVAAGFDSTRTPVSRFMTKDPVTIRADQSECEAAKIMGEHKFRRLPVVEKSGRVVGMVSISDLARHARECRGCGQNILNELVP